MTKLFVVCKTFAEISRRRRRLSDNATDLKYLSLAPKYNPEHGCSSAMAIIGKLLGRLGLEAY